MGPVSNPGPGGWAAILPGATMKRIVGHEPDTTNNRMELMAASMGLVITRAMPIDLHTDSRYVINGVQDWMQAGKQMAGKRQVKNRSNRDLWQQLDKQ